MMLEVNNKKNLNTEQKKAVTHQKNPLLIIAGAGTGKTTVLIERLSYLIENDLAKVNEVLLITFTEKATSEIEDRALQRLPLGSFDLWVHTFHGFGERILRDYGLEIGLNTDFKIISDTDQWILIQKNLDRFDLDYYRPLGNPNKFIHELSKHFSKLKDENIKPPEYLEYVKKLKTKNKKDDDFVRINELANAYELYNKILLENNFFDFGDLIFYLIKLFETRPEILKRIQGQFKYIFVDEFQDTNWSQYELIKILTNKKHKLNKGKKKLPIIMVVGDDDQAIYRFRGASMTNIMEFKNDYKDAQEIILSKNYRSGQKILDSAYKLIQKNNPYRLEEKLKISKRLSSNVDYQGEIEAIFFNTQLEELNWVGEKILDIYNNKSDQLWSDFAVLTRNNKSAQIIQSELNNKNIPNAFLSSQGLYYQEVIINILAYLRLLNNYEDSSALFRVFSFGVFQIPHADLVEITKMARRKVWSFFEAIQNIDLINKISPASRQIINDFKNIFRKHLKLVKSFLPSEIFLEVFNDLKIATLYDHDEEKEIFSFLNQFYLKIKDFENIENRPLLKDFINLIDLELESGSTGKMRQEYDQETVKIMTVHGAKGLEFDNVFLIDLVDKKFPSIDRKEKISIPDDLIKEKISDREEIHIEEERRLFYVAMTRAKKKLFLSGAYDHGLVREKKPSVFFEELGFDFSKEKKEDKKINTQLEKDLLSKNSCFDFQKKDKFVLPFKFSFSQIEAYNNCPLQYKFNFILKIPIPQKINFIFGRLMHDTLRKFLEKLLDGNGSSMQLNIFDQDKKKEISKLKKSDLLNIYEKNFHGEWYRNKEDREKYYEKGKEILKVFFEKLNQNNYPQILVLEKNFNTKIGNYFFRGAIDRIDKIGDREVEIIDYKTGSPKEKVYYKDKKQLILYKIAVEANLGVKGEVLSYYYLENNSKVSFEASEQDIEKLRNEIEETIAKMKLGRFDPKPGPLCAYCDFNQICEARQNKR